MTTKITGNKTEFLSDSNSSKVVVLGLYDGTIGLQVYNENGELTLNVINNTVDFPKGINIFNASGNVVATPTPIAEDNIPINEYVLESGFSRVITTPDGHTRLWANVNGNLKSIEF